MAPRTAIEVLVELLGAQRREARNRTSLRRESDEWIASTRRLDRLNSEIMHFADAEPGKPGNRGDAGRRPV